MSDFYILTKEELDIFHAEHGIEFKSHGFSDEPSGSAPVEARILELGVPPILENGSFSMEWHMTTFGSIMLTMDVGSNLAHIGASANTVIYISRGDIENADFLFE